MRDSFGILIDTCRKSIRYDPWTTDRGTNGYCDEIISETRELKQALKKSDVHNIEEELGDILMDWVHLTLLAESDHKLTIRDVIEKAINKIERRKPYMSENRKVTREEALDIWRKVKLEEKNARE